MIDILVILVIIVGMVICFTICCIIGVGLYMIIFSCVKDYEREKAREKIRTKEKYIYSVKQQLEKEIRIIEKRDVGKIRYGKWFKEKKIKYANDPEISSILVNMEREIYEKIYKSCYKYIKQGMFRMGDIFDMISDLKETSYNDKVVKSLKNQHMFPNSSEIAKSIMSHIDDIPKFIEECRDKEEYYNNLMIKLEDIFEHQKQVKGLKDDCNNGKKYDYYEDVNIHLFANESEKIINEFIKMPIVLALKENHDVQAYEYILNKYIRYFGRYDQDNRGEWHRIVTTDYIIAQAFYYSRGGIVEKIDGYLSNYLNYYTTEEYVEEYKVLIRIFMFLKTKKEEIMVLEALFNNNMPRSLQQEARLKFLKNKNENVPELLEVQTNKNVYAFDYRSVKWSTSETENFVDNATMCQYELITPMVIEEWEQDITVNDFVWDIEKAKKRIEDNISNEYGNYFEYEVKPAGAVTDSGVEDVSAIIITPVAGGFREHYPWLSIIIMGDQLAKSRINLAVYFVMEIEKIEKSGTIVEKNNIVKNKLLTIKESQNPKLNKFISAIKYTITKSVEDLFKEEMSNNEFF